MQERGKVVGRVRWGLDMYNQALATSLRAWARVVRHSARESQAIDPPPLYALSLDVPAEPKEPLPCTRFHL